MAYDAAASYGLSIEYEVGDMRWTANVCAPDGMQFENDLTMLCTSWLTMPNAQFWMDVLADVKTWGPLIEKTVNA